MSSLLVDSGQVTLIGAGPGDAELLTMKAAKALERATIVLVDDLVSSDVIALARSAKIIHVGKRGGCQSTPQSLIEELLISYAQKGENVIRLKGGDPFIFGRGGEEVEALQKAGINVSVITGISAGIAAPTSLMIPLTHREKAQGVVFVTGHTRPDSQDPHWEAIGKCCQTAGLTLVIFMGIKAASKIQSGLLTSLSSDSPAAIIENATLPNQRSWIFTLGSLCETIQNHNIKSPSIIVVGDVVCAKSALKANQM